MDVYFKGAFMLVILVVIALWWAHQKQHYLGIHNLLKFIIVAGVFGILLIDPDLLLRRFI